MRIPIIGDVHGRWRKVNLVVNRESANGEPALCVGDLCNIDGYNTLRGNEFIFVPGNHDHVSYMEELKRGEGKLKPIYAGDIKRVDGITVAGMGGVYSPTFFGQKEGRPLRYYGREDVERVAALRADVLLFHDAPAGIGLEKKGAQLGREEIRDVIETVQPAIAFFGHHHKDFEAKIGRTKVIGLNQPHRSYVVLDTDTFEVKRVMAELVGKEYKYGWESD